jgi:predicted DCC family thiol-disulfide oxidoreductase YuxK
MSLGVKDHLLFDGDCGICTWSAQLIRRVDPRRQFEIQPYQAYPEAELQRFGISYADCEYELQVITREGRVHGGPFGVNHFFLRFFPWNILVVLIYLIPIFLLIEIIAYRLVAHNRAWLSQKFGMKGCLLRNHST